MSTVKRAFSLTELLVAILISSLLVGITVSMYSLIRKSMAQDQVKSDSTQNARVSLDRISRELRQTPQVVTVLPANESDNSVTQPGAIEFEDGHANDLSYKRYYLSGTTLRMQVKEYYFASSPSTRVRYNAVDGSGNLPTAANVNTYQDVAEMVQSMSFYGSSRIKIVMVTGDGIQNFTLQTSVEGRN